MKTITHWNFKILFLPFLLIGLSLSAQKANKIHDIELLKEKSALWVEDNSKLSQVMVDKIFSFSE
ncbi:MAG: aminobenzoyl-glutamate utilization protein B, partial [Arcticibacterium sp.]